VIAPALLSRSDGSIAKLVEVVKVREDDMPCKPKNLSSSTRPSSDHTKKLLPETATKLDLDCSPPISNKKPSGISTVHDSPPASGVLSMMHQDSLPCCKVDPKTL
jgi:hypothetical protein